jgi:hypothetical protein
MRQLLNNELYSRSPGSPLASTVGLEVSESVAGEPLKIRGSALTVDFLSASRIRFASS